MKIYLLDINPLIIKAWQKHFDKESNVEVVYDNFEHFMNTHKVDCIVSPGNSKGIMAGGYDYAISEYFGWELTKNVQKYINDNFDGQQPVGSAFIIKVPNNQVKLIHCPTMIRPSIIKDINIIKQCMISTLKIAKENEVKLIVIPAFGGATGNIKPDILAKQMHEGYMAIKKDA